MLVWALHCSQLPSPPQPSVTQLLHSDGHISRGRNDQHPVVTRTQDGSGMAPLGMGVNDSRGLMFWWVQAGG